MSIVAASETLNGLGDAIGRDLVDSEIAAKAVDGLDSRLRGEHRMV